MPNCAKISVVIPTYNRVHLLKEAIASIQAQSFADWTMLVVDDGSTDDTAACVQAMAQADPRLTYIHQTHRGFPAAGLNRALARIDSEYFYKHDDDDLAYRDKLTHCVAFMDTHPNCFAVRVRFRETSSRAPERSVLGMPLFFRTDMLRALKGWNEFYPTVEDTEILERGKDDGFGIGTIDRTLYHYRRHMFRPGLSNLPNLLSYRVALYVAQQWRRWGLGDPTCKGWSAPRTLQYLCGWNPPLPDMMAHRLQKDLRVDNILQPNTHLIWNGLTHGARALSSQHGVAKLRPTYRSLRMMWRRGVQAQLPLWYRLCAARYVLAHAFSQKRRRAIRQQWREKRPM